MNVDNPYHKERPIPNDIQTKTFPHKMCKYKLF